MNEDKPAARPDTTEQPPSLVEKVGTHPLGVAAGPGGSLLGAVDGALLGGALGASATVGPQIDVSKEDHCRRGTMRRVLTCLPAPTTPFRRDSASPAAFDPVE